MDDLDQYIEERSLKDSEFKSDFIEGYHAFKIGLTLKKMREESGMTQSEIALKMGTQKTAISRIENHADNMRLSTLEKFANALGKRMQIIID